MNAYLKSDDVNSHFAEMFGHLTMLELAVQDIENRTQTRQGIALEIRAMRSGIRNCAADKTVTPEMACAIRNWAQQKLHSAPFKASPYLYLVNADKEETFAHSKWSNPHSNEYYSADGYDDYQFDLRQDALGMAEVYRVAAGLLLYRAET